MFRAKNYLNRPSFHGVIQKITLAQLFFETRCMLNVHKTTTIMRPINTCTRFLFNYLTTLDEYAKTNFWTLL